jgi:hypothetical protein
MVTCEASDFQFPMKASIYYPIVEQSAYGNVEKDWVLDKIIACSFTPSTTTNKENIKPGVTIAEKMLLLGRTRTDIRISKLNEDRAVTNVIVSNISDKNGNPIYLETSGPRAGKSTLFEIATIEPFMGPFGDIEHYSITLRRSENQAVTL